MGKATAKHYLKIVNYHINRMYSYHFYHLQKKLDHLEFCCKEIEKTFEDPDPLNKRYIEMRDIFKRQVKLLKKDLIDTSKSLEDGRKEIENLEEYCVDNAKEHKLRPDIQIVLRKIRKETVICKEKYDVVEAELEKIKEISGLYLILKFY